MHTSMTGEPGRFISFEGPEGSGKSTQAACLIQRLELAGKNVLSVREPGGTSTGEAIREILQYDRSGEAISPAAEALLFAASRAQLVHFRIRPALLSGTWVVCDRFVDSTTAYQGYGRGFGADQMEALNRFAVGETIPDLTILLDLPVEKGGHRLAARCEESGEVPDRIEREGDAFHHCVRKGYLALARKYAQRVIVVEADRDLDSVTETVWRLIEDRFQIEAG